MNYVNPDSSNGHKRVKKNLKQVNLVVFLTVVLVLALVSYMVGRDIASQMVTYNQQTDTTTGIVESTPVQVTPASTAVVVAAGTTTQSTNPTQIPAQLPATTIAVAVAPTTRANATTAQNPTSAAAAPPPVTTQAVTSVAPKAPVTTKAPVTKAPAPKVTQKPVPVTRGS